MNAVVNGARSRSTLLTGAAGLLLLVTAVVMMVVAPRVHVVRHGSATREQLASWVWVTRDHWKLVTPGTVGELTQTHRAFVP